MASFVERTFATELDSERDKWVESIQKVSQQLNKEDSERTVKPVANGSSPKPAAKKTIEHFEMLKVLGKGTFGKVVLCRDKETKQV